MILIVTGLTACGSGGGFNRVGELGLTGSEGGEETLDEATSHQAGIQGEITFGRELAVAGVTSTAESFALDWEGASLSIDPEVLPTGAIVRVIEAQLPDTSTLILNGRAVMIELDSTVSDADVIEIELTFDGLPLDAGETDYDIYRALQTEDGIQIDYAWARLDNGTLQKQVVYEPGAVYFAVNQDKSIAAARDASSHGWNIPLLTTQSPEQWYEEADREPTKLNIILFHGLDMDILDGDVNYSPDQMRFSEHWVHYSDGGDQDAEILALFPDSWKAQTTIWHYYYETVWTPLGRISSDLSMRINDQILRIDPGAEIVFAGYSKGALVALAGYDRLQTSYGYDAGVIDGLVTLNGASLGCEAVNVALDGKINYLYPGPKAQGLIDLRSIYNVRYLGNDWWPGFATDNANTELRARINEYLPRLQDGQWFYPVTGQADDFISAYGFNLKYSYIREIEVGDGDWRPVAGTRFVRDGELRNDGILTGYCQEIEGAVGEFSTEDVPEYEHGLNHLEIVGNQDPEVLGWLQEIFFEIACRLLNEAPVAVLTILPDPATGPAPLTVTFDARDSHDPEGCDLDFEWDFDGDGVYSELDNGEYDFKGINVAQHIYGSAGTYNAAVMVRDRCGAECVSNAGVTVEESTGDPVICYSARVDGQLGIYTMAADGGNQQLVLALPNASNAGCGAWSPDKSKIAFYSNEAGGSDLYVVNADGTGKQRVTSDGAVYYQPDWEDGDTLVYMTTVSGEREIGRINIDGSGKEILSVAGDGIYENDPKLSPDGTRIAVARGSSSTSSLKVYTADYPSFDNLILVGDISGDGDRNPDWSTDGRITWNTVDAHDIYIADADGSNPVMITTATTWEAQPVFSADGSKLVYRKRTGTGTVRYNLWMIDLESMQASQLVDAEMSIDADWYVPPVSSPWRTLADMPSSFEGGSAVYLNGKVYANDWSRDPFPIDVYDIATDTWEDDCYCLPHSNHAYRMVVYDNLIYFVGGSLEYAVGVNHVWILDPGTGAWTQGPDLNYPRYGPECAVVNGMLYVFGGKKDVDEYCLQTEVLASPDGQFSVIAEMPEGRYYSGVGVIGDNIFAAGGKPAYGVHGTDQCLKYDTCLDTWEYVASMPNYGWAYYPAMVYQDKLYVVHQQWTQCYDPATDSWTQMTSAPLTWDYEVGAASPTALYMWGSPQTTGGYGFRSYSPGDDLP